MTPCIATVTLSGGLRDKVRAIAGAGFRHVELTEPDFSASGLTPAGVRRLMEDHGLELAVLQPLRDVEGLLGADRTRAFARAEHMLDVAADMGAPMVLVCSAVTELATPDPDRAAADLAELADLATSRGLRVGYEALSWGRHVADHAAAWGLVRRADHPALGVVLDSFHTLATDAPTDDIAQIPGEKIFLVQVSDAPRIRMEILRLSRRLRRLPGLGDLDLARFMAAVRATGYDGLLSLEVFADELRGADPVASAHDAMLSTRRLLAAPQPAALPALGLTIATADALPAPIATLAGDALRLVAGPQAPVLDLAAGCADPLAKTPAFCAPGAAGLRFDATPGAGIDHVVLSAPADLARNLKVRLSSALGRDWQDMDDLPDPNGPLRLARLAGSEARLIVATTDLQRTAPARSGQSATAIELVAIATPDIVATARALTEAGHALLPVPEEHHQLAAITHDLPESLVAELRAHRIYFDRDANGAFLQIFLRDPTCGIRLLSVVERRGSYAGFGFCNSAIWLNQSLNA